MQRHAWVIAAALTVACGDGNGPSSGGGDHVLKAVVTSLRLGQPPGAYAADLDGDGDKDDGLGRIVGSLASTSGIDLQGGIDDAIAAGDTLFLIEVASHDEDFAEDEAATLTIRRALAQANPNLAGGGTFVVDGTASPVALDGAITGGVFRSRDPSGPPQPLGFALGFGGEEAVEVPVIDVHVTVSIDGAAQSLSAGKLTGAVLADALRSAVTPVLTAQYNAQIAATPTDATTLLILNIFDTGGCDGGIADNSVIESCEVATNGLLGSVLAADVDILDANGNVAPKANGPKDAISLGIGFSGVRATY